MTSPGDCIASLRTWPDKSQEIACHKTHERLPEGFIGFTDRIFPSCAPYLIPLLKPLGERSFGS